MTYILGMRTAALLKIGIGNMRSKPNTQLNGGAIVFL